MVQYLHHPACTCEGDFTVCLDKDKRWSPRDLTKEQKKKWRAIRKKQYFKNYYQKNSDTIKSSAATWFQENTDRKLEMMRKNNDRVRRLKSIST